MIISWDGGEDFTIKTKNKTVKIGKSNSIGELKISGPGEYESGGVQIEMIDGTIELLAEKITVAWIKKAKTLSDEELERLGGVDVLLVGVGGGDFSESKTAIEVINQIEPRVVVPMYSEGLDSFLKEEGGSVEGIDQYKFAANELPLEERKVVVLNPSS